MKRGRSCDPYPRAVGLAGYPPARPLGVLDLIEITRRAGVGYQLAGTRRPEPAHRRRYPALARRLDSPFLRAVIDDVDDHPPEQEVFRKILEN